MKRIVTALCMSLSTFTAIPCPYRPFDEEARPLAVVCLPIVGAVVGLLWYLLALLGGRWLPGILGALIVVLPWLLTGIMHLDGFMDTSDALLSWRPLEQRLKILKDPHAGAFSIIALAVLALVSYDAASGIAPGSDLRLLLFIPVISRCGSAFCVLTLPTLSKSEYSGSEGTAAQRLAIAAMWLIAIIFCALWLRGQVVALLVETAAYAVAMFWAYRVLKGVSGDIAGFALSIAECAALVSLAARTALF